MTDEPSPPEPFTSDETTSVDPTPDHLASIDPDSVATGSVDAASDAAAPGIARRRIPLWLLLVIGVAAGSLIGLGASALFSSDDNDADTARLSLQSSTGDEAAAQQAAKQAFLDAWRRYRNATYTAELVYERVAKDGQTLRSVSTYTQQPPRRVVRQSDSVQLTAGADSRACNVVNGALACAPAPNVDYAAEVDAEIATWRSALDGAIPYYLVSAPQPNCFQLDLAVVITDPPYGQVARFCFDENTGALIQRQIVRPTATDTEEAATISTVIPADAFTASLAPTTTR